MKKRPLHERLYRIPVYIAVVRALGYGRFPQREADARLQPLVATFGREGMLAAVHELTVLVFKGEYRRSGPQRDAEVCLSEPARKLAWQLLGPPPEHPLFREYWEGRDPPAWARTTAPKPAKKRAKKRTR